MGVGGAYKYVRTKPKSTVKPSTLSHTNVRGPRSLVMEHSMIKARALVAYEPYLQRESWA